MDKVFLKQSIQSLLCLCKLNLGPADSESQLDRSLWFCKQILSADILNPKTAQRNKLRVGCMNINIESQSRKVKNALKETIKLERAAVSQLQSIAAGVREVRISFLGVKLISCHVKSKKCRKALQHFTRQLKVSQELRYTWISNRSSFLSENFSPLQKVRLKEGMVREL